MYIFNHDASKWFPKICTEVQSVIYRCGTGGMKYFRKKSDQGSNNTSQQLFPLYEQSYSSHKLLQFMSD